MEKYDKTRSRSSNICIFREINSLVKNVDLTEKMLIANNSMNKLSYITSISRKILKYISRLYQHYYNVSKFPILVITLGSGTCHLDQPRLIVEAFQVL